MRGDQKWPPAEVKKAMQENEEQIRSRNETKNRPLKIHKDYSNFFAQHSLRDTYPGYKAPPGTQFFEINYQR
ncbi:hypothetical protein TKK_0007659 [Trichogramma kaykai]|uniref:Uncharacterized protein n=1 Tax=Trichogramma kaykai TaxID=54128 RepID=A0ABD2X745_9HYME